MTTFIQSWLRDFVSFCQICKAPINREWNDRMSGFFDVNGNNYQAVMLYCPKCWDFILHNEYRTSDPEYRPLYSGEGMDLKSRGYLWCKHYPRKLEKEGHPGIYVVEFKVVPHGEHSAFWFDTVTGENPGLHTGDGGGCFCTHISPWCEHPEWVNLD